MRSTRLPRLVITAAIGTVLLPVPTLLGSAHAGTAVTVKVPLAQASWFWRGQPGAIGSTGIAPPAAVPDPEVPAGDLAVSGPEAPAAAGLPAGPIAETYLLFDVSSLPVGATVTSFVVSLPVDSKGVTADPVGATIIACPATTGWSGGQTAAAYGGKPTDGCDVHSPKLTAVDGGDRYTVDIADIAQRWVKPNALNLGVAITDNPTNTLTAYQVVFGPPTALTGLAATVTYTAPASEPTSAPPSAGGRVVATGTGSGGDATPVTTTEPLPPGLPAQVAQPPAPTVAPVTPVVAMTVKPADPSAPPLGFWVALVLIVLLLGATTFVLAEPRAMAPLMQQEQR
ncbi:MAG TPA: DNRLRE domain-containing protein [Mycobacteriales bacterium]|nr:DNRLRE domain-containing protein [Mycobacteriales bacterium]